VTGGVERALRSRSPLDPTRHRSAPRGGEQMAPPLHSLTPPMPPFIHLITPLLQQVTQVLPDTIVTKQVDMGLFQKIGVVASTFMTIAVLLLSVTLLLLVWYFRGVYSRITQLIDRVDRELIPLVRGATGLTEDIQAIVASFKGDIDQVQETVATVNTRALAVVQRVEERIERFEVLVDLVQEEAEETVVSAIAAVRGVRTGLGRVFDHNEGDDDGDDIDEGAPDAGAAYPRVRPRRSDGAYS